MLRSIGKQSGESVESIVERKQYRIVIRPHSHEKHAMRPIVTRSSVVSVCLPVNGTGATAPWDPWDASPPTLEITGTKCIWSPPTFATG